MSNYLKILLCLTISVFFVRAINADMLVTNSGQELKGTVLSIDAGAVTFLSDGERRLFKREDLLRIELTKDTLKEKSQKLSDLSDELLKRAYSERALPEKYPNAGYITLLSEVDFTYTADGRFVTAYRELIQVLRERGKGAGVVSLMYRGDVETANIAHGRTINDDPAGTGAVVYNFDESTLRESSMFYRYPDYDRVKSIKFPLSNIVVGSVLDYSYTIERKEIDTLDPVYEEVYFSGYEPALMTRVRVTYPSGSDAVDVSLKLMGEAGADYSVREEEIDGYTIITYEKADIEAIEEESYMPTMEMIMPRITVSVSPDFDDISREYGEIIKERLIISDAIKAKVDELTGGADSDEDKIFSIYEYITKEIGLIPVTPVHYSYVMNGSDKIFEKKAGGYLDKTFLFYTFLKAAGIDCEFALARKRDRGEVIKKNQSISQFDSPIVVIPRGDTKLFVSGRDKYLALTDIASSIQGGRAIILSKGRAEIIDIPLNPPNKEYRYNNFTIDLSDDGSIDITEISRVGGNGQGGLRTYQYVPERKLKQYMLKRTYGIHPNAVLKDYSFKNLADLRAVPEMKISYKIDDYMISAGGRLLAFQLPSLSYSAYGVGEKERNYPLSFGILKSNSNKYTIRLPDNYKIYYLPKEYSYRSKDFIYEASFKVEGNEIVFIDKYKRLSAFAEKEAYADLKECLETRANLAKEWIVIEKKRDVLPN